MDKKNLIIGIIGGVAALPYIYAEYRRIMLGNFDLLYWVLSALLILSAIAIYLIISPIFMKNYESLSDAEREKKNLDITTVRTNCLSVSVFAVAIYAFLVSGIFWLIGPK